MKKDIILVIGANGQLGTVLTQNLQVKYGKENVIASDLRDNPNFDGSFECIDATDINRILDVVDKYNVSQIYHLAAILSAKGEQAPLATWDINMKTLFNVLEVGRMKNLDKIFYPSSIAVFGDAAAVDNTPQDAFLNPTTVYGISKASGENWAQYYNSRYGLDVRSVRYPGVIGYQSLPGGGTTDYAVDIFHKAIQGEEFSCFLDENCDLPMIFMDDAIRATIELMEAPKENIKIRTSYNLAGVSFTPAQLVESILKYQPDFKCTYEPDFRQAIAASWPNSIDDSAARNDWNWKHEFDLDKMTQTMLTKLKEQYVRELV